MEMLSEMRLNAENKLKKRREYKKGLFCVVLTMKCTLRLCCRGTEFSARKFNSAH